MLPVFGKDGFSLRAKRVRSRSRFGKRISPNPFRSRKLGKLLLLLFFGAEINKRRSTFPSLRLLNGLALMRLPNRDLDRTRLARRLKPSFPKTGSITC